MKISELEAVAKGASHWRTIGELMESELSMSTLRNINPHLLEDLKIKAWYQTENKFHERYKCELRTTLPPCSCWLCYISDMKLRAAQMETTDETGCDYCPVQDWLPLGGAPYNGAPCESGIYGRWRENKDIWYDRVFFAYLIGELIEELIVGELVGKFIERG